MQQKIGELECSRLCLGTMTFGEQTSEADSYAQLDMAFEHGLNCIDTAELYSVPARAETYGASERIVGNWLRRQDRDKIIVATKVAGPSRNMEWIRGGPKSLDRSNIRAALQGSLQRLQTEYVDLYQIHWPERNQPLFGSVHFDPQAERPAISIRAQLEVLAELVAEGKIRSIGLSNESPWGIMQFLRLAEEHALPRVLTVQNAYNLLNRTFESCLYEVCHRESVGLLPYSVLAFGLLTGKYRDNPQASGRLKLFPSFGQRYEKPNVQPAVDEYCRLAHEHGLTPTQLALAFACSRPFVTSCILGASNVEQLGELLPASETTLSDELIESINQIHLRYTNPAP